MGLIWLELDSSRIYYKVNQTQFKLNQINGYFELCFIVSDLIPCWEPKLKSSRYENVFLLYLYRLLPTKYCIYQAMHTFALACIELRRRRVVDPKMWVHDKECIACMISGPFRQFELLNGPSNCIGGPNRCICRINRSLCRRKKRLSIYLIIENLVRTFVVVFCNHRTRIHAIVKHSSSFWYGSI